MLFQKRNLTLQEPVPLEVSQTQTQAFLPKPKSFTTIDSDTEVRCSLCGTDEELILSKRLRGKSHRHISAFLWFSLLVVLIGYLGNASSVATGEFFGNVQTPGSFEHVFNCLSIKI